MPIEGRIGSLLDCEDLSGGAAVALGLGTAVAAPVPHAMFWTPDIGGLTSERVPSEFNAPPTALAFGEDRVDVVGVGSDSQMWHNYKVGANPWRGWETRGILPVIGQISASTWTPSSPDRLDLIARGPAGDCWHLFYDTTYGGWGPRPGGATAPAQWAALGGKLNNDPVSASWGPNRIDVVAVGSDNRLYHRYADGAWRLPHWERISNFATHGRPSLSASQAGRLDIITLDDDGQVRHAWAADGRFIGADGGVRWDTVTVSEEIPFRGHPVGVPGPGSAFNVFAVGQNYSLYNNTWYAGKWSGWNFVSNGWGQGVGDTISVKLKNQGVTVVMQGRGSLANQLLYVLM